MAWPYTTATAQWQCWSEQDKPAAKGGQRDSEQHSSSFMWPQVSKISSSVLILFVLILAIKTFNTLIGSQSQQRSQPTTQSMLYKTVLLAMTILQSEVTSTKTEEKDAKAVSNMLATTATLGGERYLNPDYLSPLSPLDSEKSGKSPLQLLVQTCSQIGADTSSGPSSKSERSVKCGSRSPLLIVSDVTKTETRSPEVAFKPYETSRSKRCSNTSPAQMQSPSSPAKVALSPPHLASSSTLSQSSSSPSVRATSNELVSGLDVFTGQPKDAPLAALASGSHSHALEALVNPAFRSGLTNTGLNVCVDPFCRDPVCPTAVYHAHLAANYAYADALHVHKMATSKSSSSGPVTDAFVCNWMNGRDGPCGKRHNSAEELLMHLRTHTGGGGHTNNVDVASTPNVSAMAALSATLQQRSSLHLAAAHRYHPYAKSPSVLPNLNLNMPVSPVSPLLGAYSPSASAAASLYALYSSRLNNANAHLPP